MSAPFRLSFLCVALVMGLAVSAAPAAAQTTMPPDEVRLTDGTYLRGTIVERSPTQLVIMLPTGETRTYPADQVASAGRAVPAAPAPAPAAPSPPPAEPSEPMAHLHVSAGVPGLSLHRLAGTATMAVWIGNRPANQHINEFELVCNAPCDADVPLGSYRFGVALGEGSPLRAGGPFEVAQDLHLHIDYEDRSETRTAGWITLGVGGGIGLGMVVLASNFAHPVNDSAAFFSLVIAGIAIGLGSIIAALVLLLTGDSASVEEVAQGVRF